MIQRTRQPADPLSPTAAVRTTLPDQWEMAARLGTGLVIIPDAAQSPAVENPGALLAVLLPLPHGRLSATTPTR